jgi:hypothetical protein
MPAMLSRHAMSRAGRRQFRPPSLITAGSVDVRYGRSACTALPGKSENIPSTPVFAKNRTSAA